MNTLFKGIGLVFTGLIAIAVFLVFILLELYVVGIVDNVLKKQYDINISWILWTFCFLVIVYEIFSFIVNIIWRSLIGKLRDLFSLR